MGKKVPKLGKAGGVLVCLYLVALGAVIAFIVFNNDVPVLNPQGMIASEQRSLLGITTFLMLLVIVPVFILVAWISWKYRASNKKAKYTPNWDKSNILEAIWWGFPLAIIAVLSVITFLSSHALDHFKPIESDKPPIKVQVVALQWKWLFIYPEQGIAAINEIRFPEKTPVNFTITSDAPMNSFWIPALGGQVYAMSGMSTKLHLIADKVGVYNGASANISGEGFAGMKFKAHSVSEIDFENWVHSIKNRKPALNIAEYDRIALPTQNNPVKTYTLADKSLYDKIVMKYMGHGGNGVKKEEPQAEDYQQEPDRVPEEGDEHHGRDDAHEGGHY